MANKWFKFYGGDYLSDPKIERLTPTERSCWLTILCIASMGDDGAIEFLTTESLLNKSGVQFDPYNPEEWDNSLGVLKKFEKLKMISLSEEGTITVLNWAKRQEHNLTVAERVAKSRAKKKESKEDVTINVTNVTTDKNRIEENRIEENRREENKRENKKLVAFAPPSLLEVSEYCKERNNGIEANNFIDFYSSKGWMVGKNKMKDWRAAVRTWEGRTKERENNSIYSVVKINTKKV